MKNITTKIAVYAIWVLILLLGISVVKSVGRAAQIRNQIQAEKDKIAKIQSEDDKLLEELAHAQSPDFIEKEVRDKLGLGKEGEAMVVLPDAETLRKLAPQMPVEADTLPDPNWKKWLKLFM